MTVFNLMAAAPESPPDGTRVYDLEQHARAGSRDPFPDALVAIPADSQLMFERPGSGPGRGGVLRLLLNFRRPDLDRERFAHHWREVHAPLAIGMNPHYDHYTTHISLDPASPWDGVLQEWFPDLESFEAHEAGLGNVKQEVFDDYALFLADSAECPQWIGVER